MPPWCYRCKKYMSRCNCPKGPLGTPPKKPAQECKSIPFPRCATDCAAVEYLGACECANICNYKFDRDDNPRPKWDKGLEDACWRMPRTGD